MAGRIDIGAIRRAQIVDAACRVIQRKGIQNASLAEIEQEAGISHGVLTYHFPSKESIILAVFDATIERMKQDAVVKPDVDHPSWERLAGLITFLLTEKPQDDEFDCLQYTFLAQMSHREDFRARLAADYADIRKHIADDLAAMVGRAGLAPEDAQAMSAIVHGALSGLVIQLNVDPEAFDRQRVLRLLEAMILGYFGRDARGHVRKARATKG